MSKPHIYIHSFSFVAMTFRLVIISSFFLASCNDPVQEQPQPINTQTDSTLILGVSPFDTYLNVVSNNAFVTINKTLASLKGDEVLGVKAQCEINVILDDSIATHIHADIFPVSAVETNVLWQKLYDHISTKYGETSYDDGFAAWNDLTIQERKFEIHLTNDSREVGKPYIGLVCDEKY